MILPSLMVETYSRLTAACVAGLWQGGVLVLLAVGLLRLMPRASASLRHALLVAIFAVAGILPWLRLEAAHAQPVSDHAVRIAPWLALAIAGVWVAAAAVRATGLLLAWRRLQFIRRRAVPFALEGSDSFTAGRRRATLCLSSDVDSPTILGFLQPCLLLPDWMAPQLTSQDLRHIALHECEHLRRYDDWLNLLLQAALVLSPLNPTLVWLDRRIGTQRELACDAAVVASTAQPIAYATCLTRLAEQRLHRNRLVLALAAMGRTSELGQRVHALLNHSAAWTQRQSRLAATVTVALMLAGTFGLARTPLLVRIATAPSAIAAANPTPLPWANEASRMPQTVRAVPASFIVRSAPANASVMRIARKPLAPRKPAFHAIEPQPAQPILLRTRATAHRATASSRPLYRYAGFQDGADESTFRFITTDFSSPYVAVPIANGWLVFQL